MWVRSAISVGRPSCSARLGEGRVDGLDVVAVVHAQHPPAVGLEAAGDVLAEGQVGGPVQADVVVVPDPDELLEAEEAGDRGGLVRDALHQVAVGADEPGAVVHDLVALAVEARGQHRLGQREAHRVGEALAERPGGDLDARGVAPLRVARRLGAELAEAHELLHGHVVAREVEHRVEQHRGVARRQHEAVAPRPLRVGRVEAHVPREEGPRRPGRDPSGRRGGRCWRACTPSIASVRTVVMLSSGEASVVGTVRLLVGASRTRRGGGSRAAPRE